MSKVEGAIGAKSGQGCSFTGAGKKAWVGWTIVNRKKIKVTVPLLGKVPKYKMYFKFHEYFWSPKSSVYLLGLPICKSVATDWPVSQEEDFNLQHFYRVC